MIGFKEFLEEAIEGNAKKNRRAMSSGKISKDEFDRRMGYGKHKGKRERAVDAPLRNASRDFINKALGK